MERVVLLGLLALVSSSHAEAGCPSSLADVHLLSEQALLGYENWEFDGFKETRTQLDALVLCAADPLDPLTASQVHLVHALASGLDKNLDEATQNFRALLATDPTYVLPDSLAAPGSLLQRAFAAAKEAEDGHSQRVRVEQLWLDGSRARRLPSDRPYVVQINQEGGLKTWLVAAPPLPDDLMTALGPPPPSRRTAALAGAGAVSVVAGGALLYLAHRDAASLDATTPPDEGAALLAHNHALALGGAALEVAGLGLGALTLTLELKR